MNIQDWLSLTPEQKAQFQRQQQERAAFLESSIALRQLGQEYSSGIAGAGIPRGGGMGGGGGGTYSRAMGGGGSGAYSLSPAESNILGFNKRNNNQQMVREGSMDGLSAYTESLDGGGMTGGMPFMREPSQFASPERKRAYQMARDAEELERIRMAAEAKKLQSQMAETDWRQKMGRQFGFNFPSPQPYQSGSGYTPSWMRNYQAPSFPSY